MNTLISKIKLRPSKEESLKIAEANKTTKKGKKIIMTKKGMQVVSKPEQFLEEFIKNGGNATQASLVINNVTSLASAANMGSYYLKKAKALGRVYLEKKGYGYGKMLDVAAEKMVDSKTPEWWDRLMKVADYADFFEKPKNATPAVVNVIQSHKDRISSYIEGEEVKINEDKI